jgi:excisionase family DNA binding protein
MSRLGFGRNNMDDRWLSVDDICIHLGISRDTVYKWIDRKGMPAHRVGRLWKFMKAEVDEWVRRGGANEKRPEEDNERR